MKTMKIFHKNTFLIHVRRKEVSSFMHITFKIYVKQLPRGLLSRLKWNSRQLDRLGFNIMLCECRTNERNYCCPSNVQALNEINLNLN